MSAPRKILIVIGQLEIGGTERHLLNTLPEVAGQQLAISIYALRGGGRLEAQFKNAGVRVLGPEHHSHRWVGLVRTVRHLIATMRAERPDVVHFFLPEAYLLGGLCSLFTPKCVRLMSRRSLNLYQRKWSLVRPIEQFLHARMDGVLANSQAVLRELRAEGVGEQRSGIIYNGVQIPRRVNSSTKNAVRERLGLAPEVVVFVMVANLIPYKGHRDLLAAFSIACPEFKQPWALLLVGADNGIGDELRTCATHYGLTDHIHWLGQQDNVDEFLTAADIALLTSHEEGFSNAILEAMAAGLPMIVTAVGGNAEAVIDGETGLIVPPSAPKALAAAIVGLALNPELRRLMGGAGRERVTSTFEINHCIVAYRKIYSLLSSGTKNTVGSLLRAPA
jgi:glycosyltransferase involved in cell wall biosynthesis